MRRTTALLGCLALVLAACGDDKSSSTSSDSKASGSSSGGLFPSGNKDTSDAANDLAAAGGRPLTAADVEKFIELMPDFNLANDLPSWSAAAQKHGLTVQQALDLSRRVSIAYVGVSTKYKPPKPSATYAQDVEVVRPYADRIKAVMKK